MGIPVLILEVTSDVSKHDMWHMFLQGTCLVHLGNSLLKPGSPPFIVRAIYIDQDYYASEYTLYQADSQTPGDEEGEVIKVIVLLIAK